MSEVSIGFIANVAVVGLVSYTVIFKVVDRICKCVENINASNIVFDKLIKEGKSEVIEKIIDMRHGTERTR